MCIIIVRDIHLLYIRQLDKLRRELDDDMETASALCVVLNSQVKPKEFNYLSSTFLILRHYQLIF